MYSVQHIIETALKEDIGPGDITTNNLIGPDAEGRGIIIAKDSLVLAGLGVAKQVFEYVDSEICFDPGHKDGDILKHGDIVMEIEGRLRSLLAAERTALNFLQHLSGIATHVRSYVNVLEGKNVRLVDTRKTTPGWLILEKYAVRMGGAHNHRMGLYDGVVIKNNHITVCGGIKKAIERIRKNTSHFVKTEVEVSDMEGVREAMEAKADVVMLTHMDIGQIKKAVSLISGKIVVEVSGEITKHDLIPLADTGVDIISLESLTQLATCVNITMEINEVF
ncbi:carboxylating nicotinate-nucleotide diphosphorylase [Desulfonema magnum]|uniref:Probable nicotinate-nucleotide pyrophosphorylase [carboxylating] n=1 Tax=Desulfonema magnum TaxID=45655 RepID=A0A975BS98_9BACT|nr:carboxylating nicotinate-nucleotide diphosphorylase [Desulfonema magnum]QTA90889.1 putative nicotinate-nucleotide pyrophosphorylase [Desulfonema magnum]